MLQGKEYTSADFASLHLPWLGERTGNGGWRMVLLLTRTWIISILDENNSKDRGNDDEDKNGGLNQNTMWWWDR